MNFLSKSIFAATLALVGAGCYYDTASTLYGTKPVVQCDTTNVTYLKTIAPIINLNCNSCHSTSQAPISGKGVVLDTYISLQNQAVNSTLLDNINQVSGVNPMPNNGTKLSDCDILKIQHWVDLGAPNN